MKSKRSAFIGRLILFALFAIGIYWWLSQDRQEAQWWHYPSYQLAGLIEEGALKSPPDLQPIDLYWHHQDADLFQKEWRARAPQRPALINLYPLAGSESNYTAVLDQTLQGAYDSLIVRLARLLKQSDAKHQVAWMPFPAQAHRRWPWQMQKPVHYIEAYRHFHQLFRQHNQSTALVFQSTALPGVMEYHPGDAYLDFNSLHLLPQREENYAGLHRDSGLTQSLLRKRHRLRFTNKPILLFQEDKGFSFAALQKSHQAVAQRFRDFRERYAALSRRGFQADSSRGLEIGLYDPKNRLNTHPAVTAEHLFLNLRALEWGPFREDLAAVMARGHAAIISVEPFKDLEANHDRQVLDKILTGDYDADFAALYALLAEQKQRIYLRFAHEMEIPIKRYPWQSQDPLTYILAYRYFVHFPSVFPSHIRTIWGPAGDRAALDWFPGDDLVDFNSIAIYGLPDKGIEDHRKQEGFPRIFERKHWRLRFSEAPLFITEFGVKGPDAFQQEWLREAGSVLARQKRLKGACYFNLYDNPEVWGKDMVAPDWSISRSSFNAFVKAVKKK